MLFVRLRHASRAPLAASGHVLLGKALSSLQLPPASLCNLTLVGLQGCSVL